MTHIPVFLSGLAYEVGEAIPITSLDEIRQNPQRGETFHALGLRQIRRTDASPASLAAAAAARTLASAGLPPDDVECLIFATSTFWNERFSNKDINDLLCNLELSAAYPVGITLSQCGNALTALRTAAALLRSEEKQNILVATSDTIAPGASRLVPPDVSLASDAAATFLVTSSPLGDFELLALQSLMKPRRYVKTPFEDFTRYLVTSSQGLKEICQKTMRLVGKTPADFRWLLPNNYNHSVARFFSAHTGFPIERIYLENVGRHGHTFAADCFMNLRDCAAEYPLQRDDLVLLLASGFHMWSAAVLRKT